MSLKYLLGVIIAGAFIGCAPIQADVTLEGTIHHEISINVENLEVYFTSVCRNKVPEDDCYYPLVSDCVSCMMADFFSIVSVE